MAVGPGRFGQPLHGTSESTRRGGLVLALVFLSAMSVVGDLVESLVKRSAGAKDSSACCPATAACSIVWTPLLPVFPIAMALSTL